ncbi:hypothetical protein Sipo8835_00145 [Streptomyces ipomoeae]|uniref:Uncharacterized protein n=1 Tax=Streptomyces ipomoeae TaxID=103232 RepID=A0AAE8WAD9_9ACTN|nr:hypothetical protein [Streptomyces ipomoeae]TQE40256.1 hypothetical protein Sipo8835_00145 [Streptomyces ipomoeae]
MTNSVRHTTGNVFGLTATPAAACVGNTRPRVKVDPTHPRVDAPLSDDTRITYKAAAVYLAGKLYDQALKEASPVATLDDIANAIPEVMPEAFNAMGTAPGLAAVLLPEVTDLVWAYTAIEHARIEAGDGCDYLFDLLADGLKNGADPHIIRTDALAAPGRIRELAEQAGDSQ